MALPIVKAHAYGNDFLLVPSAAAVDGAEIARQVCDRHAGIGADGLILYALRDRGASMTLFNADGSRAELSGNGLRCLGALVVRREVLPPHEVITIDTDAGTRKLEFLERLGSRYTFRAAMGQPSGLRQVRLAAAGEEVTASILDIGNPQCVVLGQLPDPERFARLGRALAMHPMFPAGTNVEFVEVDAPGRLRILIWERGVGPTSSSGTGTVAAAVAAAVHGGALRAVDVIAPGGTQRVEWGSDGVYLTGWAEVTMEGHWVKES